MLEQDQDTLIAQEHILARDTGVLPVQEYDTPPAHEEESMLRQVGKAAYVQKKNVALRNQRMHPPLVEEEDPLP